MKKSTILIVGVNKERSNMAAEDTTIQEALTEAAIDTLVLYKEHMRNGRYSDAQNCLNAVDDLTGQTVQLEDHVEEFNASMDDVHGVVNNLFTDRTNS